VPTHLLLPQKGIVTIVNRQNVPVAIKTSLASIKTFELKAGQKRALAFEPGEHDIWLDGFPHARLEVVVLKNAMEIGFDWETGEIEATAIHPGQYQLGFYLGARPLHIQPVTIPEQGALQIAATVSANEIVTVSVTMGVILDDEISDGGVLSSGIDNAEEEIRKTEKETIPGRPGAATLPKNDNILPSQPTTTSP
jgi:hypothetical protein